MAEGSSIVDIEWSCPSCTFINKPGSFKCLVCGTPKGTATRQMKFQYSALEQQYVAESLQASRTQSSRGLNKIVMPQPSSYSQSHSSNSTPSSSNSSPTTVPQGNLNSINPGHPLTGEVVTRKRHRVRVNPIASSASAATSSKTSQKSKWPMLRNIDRTRIINSQEITVNNVTVTITEYPLLYPDSE